MLKLNQLQMEDMDNLVCNLREYYETETGKLIEKIDVCDLTDFIKFYGGSIEYTDLDGGIKSVVVKEKEEDKFKIVVSNELEYEKMKERWICDFSEISENKGINLDMRNHAKGMLKKNPSRYLLNMELVRAFGNYILRLKEGNLNYGDALPTIHEKTRCNITQEQISNSVEIAKRLVLTDKKF